MEGWYKWRNDKNGRMIKNGEMMKYEILGIYNTTNHRCLSAFFSHFHLCSWALLPHMKSNHFLHSSKSRPHRAFGWIRPAFSRFFFAYPFSSPQWSRWSDHCFRKRLMESTDFISSTLFSLQSSWLLRHFHWCLDLGNISGENAVICVGVLSEGDNGQMVAA